MIPCYEQCLKRPPSLVDSREHVVMESDLRRDKIGYVGWCKFCGEVVYAKNGLDYWHPLDPYVISEELDVADLIPNR